MPEAFDRFTWKSRIVVWWREHGKNWPAAARQLGVRTTYGLLAGSAWLPLLAAYSDNPGAAVTALVGIVGSVGSNLVANLVQGAYAKANAPRKAEEELAERPEVRAEYEQLLEQLGIVAAAQEALGERWDEFAGQLREEVGQMGWALTIETGGGAVVAGDVTVKKGDFVGRDQVVVEKGAVSVQVAGDLVVDSREAARQLARLLARQGQAGDLTTTTQRYLECLLDRHRYLSLRGMGVADRIPLRLPLLDLYVPLQARVELPEGETWKREGLKLAGRELEEHELAGRLGTPRPVLDLLRENDGLVILGDPGAGKTTFLKYLVLKLAQGEGKSLGLGPCLPVLLPLSAYANALAADDVRLDDFIADYYHDIGADLPVGELLAGALGAGKALVLLDGLDEVREVELRHTVVGRVADFYAFHRRAGNKFVLTSRVVGYREVRAVAEGLAECTLVDLNEEEIAAFIEKWTAALERQAQGETAAAGQDAARERRELLEAVQRNPGVRRLAANPLLLTILALMKRQGVTLPERRAELYDRYVETLLSTWNRARGLGRPPARDLDVVQTVRILAPLALWMHEVNPGVGLVKREELRRKLAAIYRERGEASAEAAVRQFLADVRDHAGLLLERGAGQYGFIHLTFEEYLAAVAIALGGQQEVEPIVDYLAERVGQAAWRETSLLTVGYIGLVQQRDQAAGAVVERLVEQAPGAPGEAVVLAGEAVLDAWPGGVTLKSKDRVMAALEQAMQGREVAPILRRQAGLILGRLGWRPEDLDAFIEIAPGPFLYGEKRERREIPYPYWIGKYPVANDQYARFVEDGGYRRREFWSAEGWGWRKKQRREAPGYWNDPDWSNPIFPVVGVSWFEAEAYCRWLTQAGPRPAGPLPEGYVARLPTEEEWERAARGTDGQEYPWGQGFEAWRANTEESDVEKKFGIRTTAVCTYPGGVGPAGVWDAAGNVWEWTARQPGEDANSRVVRGGSWVGSSRCARCAFRRWYFPVLWHYGIGFRVVFSPVL